MEDRYPLFTQCVTLRELGFPQKRKYQSMYYITPDKLICIDDLSCLKQDGRTVHEDVFNMLVFKPRFEDLMEESPFLHEFIKLTDGSWFAYSNIEEDPEIIQVTGRTDIMIRARGTDPRDALINLWIATRPKVAPQPASVVLSEEEGKVEVGVLEDRHDMNDDGMPPAIVNPNEA